MIAACDDTRSRKGEPRERPWLPEHDQLLIRLRDAGLTLPVIGERLGRSKNACAQRAQRIAAKVTAPEPPRDYLGEKIEAYLDRIAKLNSYLIPDLKRECYGWR